MADTGLLSPTSTGEDHNQFTNPTNAYSSNNTYATENVSAEKQDYYNFTFDVPAGATIDGIEVKAEAVAQVSEPAGWLWDLSWNGGTNYTNSGYGSGDFIDSVEVVYTQGGATDLWGRSWTDSEFSNTNFRIRVECVDLGSGATLAIDHIQVRVYYTAVSAGSKRMLRGHGL